MKQERRKTQSVDVSTDTPFRLIAEYREGTYLDAIASWAKKNPDMKVNNLMYHFSVENLRQAHKEIPGSRAVGSDGITKAKYGQNLEGNLQALNQLMRKMSYRPADARLVMIPKLDGGRRPIAISNFEDKLVQQVAAGMLTAIYDHDFKRFSFGFRPKKSCHGAISYLYNKLRKRNHSFVVDVDLKSFFNTIDHRKLMEVIGLRIADKRFYAYLVRMLRAGILVEGVSQKAEEGTPQGSIVSPILANIFLHYVLDEWFVKTIKPSIGGDMVRYADDFVAVFSTQNKAEEFIKRLEARLNEFMLLINKDKTRVVNFSRDNPRKEAFDFLGFTFYWGKSGKDYKTTLKVKTRMKSLKKKIQEFKHWIKANRSRLKLEAIWDKVALKLQGHYNYYGVLWNRSKLYHFYHEVIGLLFKWLNRRSDKASYDWPGFMMRLSSKPLPLPTESQKLINLTKPRLYCST